MKLAWSAATMISLFAFTAAFAEPYDPKAVYYSDAVLRKAVENIAQMQEAELRAFVHYLAECGDDPTDPASKHSCYSAQTAYEVEFGNKRPLDDLIWAKSFLLQAPPDTRATDPVEISNAAIRYAKIPGALDRAAQERYRSLKSSAK
jgi:hypothetical protein